MMSKQTLHSATFVCAVRLRKKFLASTKGDPAFISKGFTYWKEGHKAFKKHQGSDCHREAVDDLIVLPRCTKDVCELQSQLQLPLFLWE